MSFRPVSIAIASVLLATSAYADPPTRYTQAGEERYDNLRSIYLTNSPWSSDRFPGVPKYAVDRFGKSESIEEPSPTITAVSTDSKAKAIDVGDKSETLDGTSFFDLPATTTTRLKPTTLTRAKRAKRFPSSKLGTVRGRDIVGATKKLDITNEWRQGEEEARNKKYLPTSVDTTSSVKKASSPEGQGKAQHIPKRTMGASMFPRGFNPMAARTGLKKTRRLGFKGH